MQSLDLPCNLPYNLPYNLGVPEICSFTVFEEINFLV